jgi:hypothetical protein
VGKSPFFQRGIGEGTDLSQGSIHGPSASTAKAENTLANAGFQELSALESAEFTVDGPVFPPFLPDA